MNCIAISPDKRLLAVGGNPLIHIFEVNGGDDKPVMTYSGHTNNVTAVGFQKDQKWLFSSSEDGTIKVWDRRFQSSSASRTYECGSSVNTVVLHPNQGVLISGDQQGYIRVWDLENNILSEQHVPINDASVRSISIVSFHCSEMIVRNNPCACYRLWTPLSWQLVYIVEKYSSTVSRSLRFITSKNGHILMYDLVYSI